MKSTIRRIGNSRGVIIPKSFIEECGMKEDVEIELRDKAIIIRAASELRKGWFVDAVSDANVLGSIPLDEDSTDWVWE
jgi:antitoxin MazE